MSLRSSLRSVVRSRAAVDTLLLLERLWVRHPKRVAGRSAEQRRRAKTEGKIKGPARGRLATQSARGVGAAPRLAVSVPRKSVMPHAARVTRVPYQTGFATVRLSLPHGFA